MQFVDDFDHARAYDSINVMDFFGVQRFDHRAPG
jgi:hypothetical protein